MTARAFQSRRTGNTDLGNTDLGNTDMGVATPMPLSRLSPQRGAWSGAKRGVGLRFAEPVGVAQIGPKSSKTTITQTTTDKTTKTL